MDMLRRNLEAAQAQALSAALNAQSSARGFARSVSEHGKALAGNLSENTKVLAEQARRRRPARACPGCAAPHRRPDTSCPSRARCLPRAPLRVQAQEPTSRRPRARQRAGVADAVPPNGEPGRKLGARAPSPSAPRAGVHAVQHRGRERAVAPAHAGAARRPQRAPGRAGPAGRGGPRGGRGQAGRLRHHDRLPRVHLQPDLLHVPRLPAGRAAGRRGGARPAVIDAAVVSGHPGHF